MRHKIVVFSCNRKKCFTRALSEFLNLNIEQNWEFCGSASDVVRPPHTLELCEWVQQAPAIYNDKFYFAVILRSDVEALKRTEVPLSRIDGCARLLNFLRQVKKTWRGTQEWYWQNVFFGLHTRQFVGECERWLVKIGVADFIKVRAFTRQMDMRFIGWPWERGEDDGENDQPWENGENAQPLEKPPKPYRRPNVAEQHSDVEDLTSQCCNPDIDPHIAFQRPSHNSAEGESVAFENGNVDQEGGCQQSRLVENGGGTQLTDNIENGKEGSSRKQKVVGSDQCSGRASPPVQNKTVKRPPPVKKRGPEPEQREKYEWEIAVGEPYPTFLQWRAKHYEKQEGSLASVPLSNAESEFYNNPERASRMFKEFLKRAQAVVENGKQAVAAGNVPVLPSEFLSVADPEPAQVMADLQQLMNAGAQIALPAQHPAQRATVPNREYKSLADAERGRCESATIGPVVTIGILGSDSDPEGPALEESADSGVPADSGVQESLEETVVKEQAEQPESEPEESAPSIEVLQDLYKLAAGRPIVRMQIARNPQWGYAIVDGQVVKVGQVSQEVQDAEEQEAGQDAGACESQDAAVPETKKMSMQELDAHIRKVHASKQSAKTQELMMEFQHHRDELKVKQKQEQELPPAPEPCPPPKLSAAELRVELEKRLGSHHPALQQPEGEDVNGEVDWAAIGEKMAAIEAAAIDDDTGMMAVEQGEEEVADDGELVDDEALA